MLSLVPLVGGLLPGLQPLGRAHVAPRPSAAATMTLQDDRGRAPHRRAAAAPLLEPTLDRRSLATLACLSSGLLWPMPAFAADQYLKMFPGARSSADVDGAVGRALAARGYNKDNTIFGMSVCSDEVNFFENEIIDLMKKRWGESFSLGGLAGVPFAGKAGLGAYAHHVPDDGKMFILFAPHVGVGDDGKIGALIRSGIVETSSACGAAVGAYKTLSKPGAVAPTAVSELEDLEFEYIKLKLAPKLDGIDGSANKLAYVTYQMYKVVADAMLAQIAASPGIWDDASELCVLGGVQINRFEDKDAFQPLMFQTITKAGKRTDLYPSTFGDLPELAAVMGSRSAAESVLLGEQLVKA